MKKLKKTNALTPNKGDDPELDFKGKRSYSLLRQASLLVCFIPINVIAGVFHSEDAYAAGCFTGRGFNSLLPVLVAEPSYSLLVETVQIGDATPDIEPRAAASKIVSVLLREGFPSVLFHNGPGRDDVIPDERKPISRRLKCPVSAHINLDDPPDVTRWQASNIMEANEAIGMAVKSNFDIYGIDAQISALNNFSVLSLLVRESGKKCSSCREPEGGPEQPSSEFGKFISQFNGFSIERSFLIPLLFFL